MAKKVNKVNVSAHERSKPKPKMMSEKAESKMSPAQLARLEAQEAASGQAEPGEAMPDAMPHPQGGAFGVVSGQAMPPHPLAGATPLLDSPDMPAAMGSAKSMMSAGKAMMDKGKMMMDKGKAMMGKGKGK